MKNMCLLCVSVTWCVAQNDNRTNLGSNGSSNVGMSPSLSLCVMLSNIHDGRTISNSLRFFKDATLTRPEEGQQVKGCRPVIDLPLSAMHTVFGAACSL
jgi:hypothetical protein